jgi:hypothetical protein
MTMARRILVRVTTALLIAALCGAAMAAIGPTQSPLKVTQIYMKDGNSVVYVSFQPGAMPGCYNNAGGYLYLSNPYFREIHAQLLMMIATGGARAAVLYTQNTPTNNWDDCTVDGIYLMPE